MSYDVLIGGESFNYTYNLARLFHDHFPAAEGERGGLDCLDGLTGKKALRKLSGFWESLHREYLATWADHEVGASRLCAKYDAPNGWGSLIGAMIFVAMIQSACARNRRARVRVI